MGADYQTSKWKGLTNVEWREKQGVRSVRAGVCLRTRGTSASAVALQELLSARASSWRRRQPSDLAELQAEGMKRRQRRRVRRAPRQEAPAGDAGRRGMSGRSRPERG